MRTYDKLIATIQPAKARARLRACFGMARFAPLERLQRVERLDRSEQAATRR